MEVVLGTHLYTQSLEGSLSLAPFSAGPTYATSGLWQLAQFALYNVSPSAANKNSGEEIKARKKSIAIILVKSLVSLFIHLLRVLIMEKNVLIRQK
jgi:hypothetical protein